MNGPLLKLTIIPFADIAGKIPLPYPPFVAMFNPTSLTVTHNSNYCTTQSVGAADAQPQFKNLGPKTFSLELMLDGTGASALPIPVPAMIEAFKLATYHRVPETHRPPYLIMIWGTFIENVVLTSLNITYELFSPQGIPIRAKLNAGFKTCKPLLQELNESFLNSPDLTHTRTVKAGDTLPLLCKEIYGDEEQYLKVAAVNKLANYRKLKPGATLYFPPFAKNS